MKRWRRFAVPLAVVLASVAASSGVLAQGSPFGPMVGSFEYDLDGSGEANSIEQYLAGGSFGWFFTRNIQAGVRASFARISIDQSYTPPKLSKLRREIAFGGKIDLDEDINLWNVGAFANFLLPSNTRSLAPYVGLFVDRSGGTDLDGSTGYGAQAGLKIWAARDWNVDLGAQLSWSDAYEEDEPFVTIFGIIHPLYGGPVSDVMAPDSLNPRLVARTTELTGALSALVKPDRIIDLSGFVGHFFTDQFQLGGELRLQHIDPDGGDSFTSTQLIGQGNWYFFRQRDARRPINLYAGLNAGVQKITDVDAYFSYGGQVGARWQWTRNVAPFVEFRFTNYTEDFISAQWLGTLGHRVLIPRANP